VVGDNTLKHDNYVCALIHNFSSMLGSTITDYSKRSWYGNQYL